MIYSSENGDRGICKLDGEVQLYCFQCDTEKGIVWNHKRNEDNTDFELVKDEKTGELLGIATEVKEGKEVIFIPDSMERHIIAL